MVMLAGGEFVLGSPEGESGRYRNEGPQRTITIAPVAVSVTEITGDQYAAFVAATRRPDPEGCFTHGDGADFAADNDPAASWRSPGFTQTGDHPVVCVSWQDATDYAAWLSQRTGRSYRLLREAEWEYAARGGSRAPYFWGDNVNRACSYGNGADTSLVRAVPRWREAVVNARREGDMRAGILACDDGSAFTRRVGAYRPNGFGLYDMTGNVWEWVEDCWTGAGYERSVPATSANEQAPCTQRRVRGGSWDDYPVDLRLARRSSGVAPDLRRTDTGFRVARTN